MSMNEPGNSCYEMVAVHANDDDDVIAISFERYGMSWRGRNSTFYGFL